MSQPNYLLLLADQFRVDCLGALGSRGVRTPNLERLAAQSCVYTRAFTPLPVCAPIRQSLLCGLHPDSFGAQWNYDFFPTPTVRPEDSWTLRLAQRGTRMGVIGKWHASPVAGAREFGFQDIEDMTSYKRMIAEKYPNAAFTGGWLGCTSPIPLEDCDTHYMARRANELLEEYAAQDQPWHLWVDFGIPHLPCRPSEPFASMYDPKSIPPWDGFGDTFEMKPYIQRQHSINWGMDEMTWEDFQPMVARYYAMISQMDDAIGRILDQLERLHLMDNTIIIFTSDHGDMCASHQTLDKHNCLFDDTTRIPLIVKKPGVAPYQTDSFISGCLDMTASLCQWLDVSLPKLHGRPLPLCAADDADPRAYITSSCNGQQFGLGNSRMIRGDRYKYIWNLTDIDEFYDLEADPGEKSNRIAQPEYAETISSMRKALHAELVAHEDPFVGKGWVDACLLQDRKHVPGQPLVR